MSSIWTALAKLSRAPNERALQDAIAQSFTLDGIPFEREVRLSDEDRIDFLVEESVGVEVKLDGGISDVTRQLHRYAQHERIGSLILVTTKLQHARLPSSISGKSVRVLHLIGRSL